MCAKHVQASHVIIKDHGWAWVVAINAHICRILHDGIVKSFGVMLPILSFEFGAKVWEVGFSVSLMVVVGSLLVVVIGPAIRPLQPRWVVMSIGVCIWIGFILCACVSNWNVFAFCLIVIAGIPLRMSWFIMLYILGEYFDKHYVTANSIAYAGSSVAVTIFAPLTQLLLEQFGYRGTLLIIASISLHISICGAVLRLRPAEKFAHGYIDLDKGDDRKISIKETIVQFMTDVFEPRLFQQPLFWASLAAEFAINYSWTGWMVYTVAYAQSNDFSSLTSTSLSSAGGCGSLVGAIVVVFLLKTTWSIANVLVSLLLIAGCSLVVYSFSHLLFILLIVSFTFGLAANAGLIAILSMSKSLEGNLSQSVAWLFFASAIGRLFAGFFTGWIYDFTGSYDISFVVLGGVLLVVAILCAILSIWHERTICKQEKHANNDK